jgi:hypothetical protein
MEFISTDAVAEQEKCDPSTARKWASENGDQFIGQSSHKNYLWTHDDITQFQKRPKPGRRWPEKKPKKKK